MKPLTLVIAGLALATTTAAIAVADKSAWLLIGTSEDVFRTQAIHIVKYPRGMSECAEALRQVKLIRPGPSVLVTLGPFCTEDRPGLWVE